MKAKCLQAMALQLCVALSFALLIVPGYVVAPVLFAKAPSSEVAGMLAGEIFHTANMGVLFLGIAIATFWWRQQRNGRARALKSWAVLLSLLLLVAVNVYGIAPIIAELKAQAIHGITMLSMDDPLRKEFGMWHGISALTHLIASIFATLLLVMTICGHGNCDKVVVNASKAV
ncbi:MAG: DUF4149 domain-containing protein [Zetaproteobacteria bacterium]|nr:DUF4149 domain-containing protein [Zetaproteobacteria bacterium]